MSFVMEEGKKSEKMNKGNINMKKKNKRKKKPVILLYNLPIFFPSFTLDYSITLASKILVSISFYLNH